MNRRRFIKGALGTLGAAVVGFTAMRRDAEAGWSTGVCLPGLGFRLVPTASVPFFVRRYDAAVTEGRVCPPNCGALATCVDEDTGTGFCAVACPPPED